MWEPAKPAVTTITIRHEAHDTDVVREIARELRDRWTDNVGPITVSTKEA